MTYKVLSDQSIMRLSDLRCLGRQGGAILTLDDGRQALIKPQFAVVIRPGKHTNDPSYETSEILRFHLIYHAITIVKRKHFIIARKIQRNQRSQLVLTGIGYHR
ncbi:hypothetical protein C1H88_00110 [Streptococcus agalactiae]|uniref:hypothetical protein n=1 Tax=Streptococcus agalactiae TaxID=1311 RepID=UPI001010E956|nr:hypothetical protein [Streptococcus agalactiae]RXN51063.1 hypothetical protein C1H88_00110 [Streptococcus agalactiae]